MLELFRESPRFGGSARENIVLNRLAFRVGLTETRIREMLASGRRKSRAGRWRSSSSNRRQAAPHAGRPDERGGKLERELLECVIADPAVFPAVQAVVVVEDFEDEAHRRLLALCYRLADAGLSPSYENLIAGTEEADLKGLLVTLETTARAKVQTLRLDGPEAAIVAQQALPQTACGLWETRAETHAVSVGRLASSRTNLPARSTRPNSIICDARWKFTASAQSEHHRSNRRTPVHRLDDKLNELIAIGKGQGGWLTFSQVNDYLPDEAVNPEKLDTLLMSLEEIGMEIVADAKLPYKPPEKKKGKNGRKAKEGEEKSRRIDDPVRMYLTQMGEIPLFSRERGNLARQENRGYPQAFPPPLLECDYALKGRHPEGVHISELPFDRTIKVSLTENLEKDKILERMPQNLKTLEYLLEQNIDDFKKSIDPNASPRKNGGPAPQPEAPPAQDGDAGRRAVDPHAAGAAADEEARADLAPHGRARAANRRAKLPRRAEKIGPISKKSCAT